MDLALSTVFVLFVLSIPVLFTVGVLLFLYASSTLAGGAARKLASPAASTTRVPQFTAPQGFQVVGFSQHHK